MKYIYSTSQMSKLSLTLCTFSITSSVAGLFLTYLGSETILFSTTACVSSSVTTGIVDILSNAISIILFLSEMFSSVIVRKSYLLS